MQDVRLSPMPMREDAATITTVHRVRQRPVRVPRGRMPGLRSPPLRMHKKGESEARRRQRTDHSAHGLNNLLASGRDTDIRAAVHGATVREIAGVLRERGRVTGSVERPRYKKKASEGISRQRIW